MKEGSSTEEDSLIFSKRDSSKWMIEMTSKRSKRRTGKGQKLMKPIEYSLKTRDLKSSIRW